MHRVPQAGSGAEAIDPSMDVLRQQLADMAFEKAQLAEAKARAEAQQALAEAQLAEAKALAEAQLTEAKALAVAQLTEAKALAEAQQARAEAQLAAMAAEKDAYQSRADAAEKATVEKRGAGAAIAVEHDVPTPRPFGSLLMAQASERVLRINSPTTKLGGVLRQKLAVFALNNNPQVQSLAGLAQTRSLLAFGAALNQPDSLLHEQNVYPFMTSFVPAWVTSQPRPADLNTGGMSAKNLFIGSGIPPVLPRIALPWGCMPEILTSSEDFHPAFNGEAKSAQSSGDVKMADARMYDQLVTYVTLGIVGSLFKGVPKGRHRFFTIPPVGYGLAALAHVGYLVAVEWIGKLFMSVVSQPFFLGSPEHEAAIAALPDYNYQDSYEDIDFAGIPVLAWPRDDGTLRVTWRSEGADEDEFFKVIGWNSYDADHFKHMLQVYTALSAALNARESDAAPASLLRARMLFGAGEVCVKMPWIEGRDAKPADLEAGGCAVEPVARAIVWLARHGLLYVDLRCPNVRISADNHAFLVDYDDMAVCKPLTSAEELIAALLDDETQAEIGWASEGGGRALVAVLDALRQCW